jgi:hypothetical protein
MIGKIIITTHLGMVNIPHKNGDLGDGLLLFYPNYMILLLLPPRLLRL